jgi:tetratricopeptide (TPR) repeat protein
MVLGAGASLAAPAGRPLFDAIREALVSPLELDLEERAWQRFAPEALLSRLHVAGIDIDHELRGMLGGGFPNALHMTSVELLRRGNAVWTTNFDELIEEAAEQADIRFHRLLPGGNPRCRCDLGHLVKVHGTLSGDEVLARSEQVMVPLQAGWLERLKGDLENAEVAVVGYAGADIDLRPGLRGALSGSYSAIWFGRPSDRDPLERRFARLLDARALELKVSERPDLEALSWARERDLTRAVSSEAWDQAKQAIQLPRRAAQYAPNDLLRGRVLDDFGRGVEAREFYGRALRSGPRRRLAARALYSSGLMHGTQWRPAVISALNAACATPARWRWPHRQRLPYLTWNVPPDKRLPMLERSLALFDDDPDLLVCAANAAKEVDPSRAVELGLRAQQDVLDGAEPRDTAWATFILSLAYRWLGDVSKAVEQAARLADGYDSLAGPVWVAWGYFESGAVAALEGNLDLARQQMQLAVEVFASVGSIFTFDAWCGLLSVERTRGDEDGAREAYRHALELVDDGSLRRRFKREVFMVEQAEFARHRKNLDEARSMYDELARSPTLAQELLGLLGLAEVQRQGGDKPEAGLRALRRSAEVGFGYGEVHAAVTLGIAGELSLDEAERRIDASVYEPPIRGDATGLLRYCLGPEPEQHLLCFP